MIIREAQRFAISELSKLTGYNLKSKSHRISDCCYEVISGVGLFVIIFSLILISMFIGNDTGIL